MTFHLRSSLGWTYGTSAFNLLLQFVFVAILSRLVSPLDYGIMAVVTGAIGYLSYFSDFGIAQTTMRNRDLTPGDLWGIALIALAGNLLVVGGLYFFSTPISQRLGLPAGSDVVLCTLAFLAPLSGLQTAAIAWLNRDLQFRHLGLISVAVKLFGQGAVTLPLAAFGYGIWALIAGALAQPFLGFALGLWLGPRELPSLSRWRRIVDGATLGLRFSLIRVLGATRSYMLPIVIGILVGTPAAGLYDRAALLSLVLADILLAGIGRILSPVYCRLIADRPQDLAITFQFFTLRILCLALPVLAGLIAAASPLVLTLLGDRWADAAHPLQILAAMAICRVLSVTLGSVIEAKGNLHLYTVQTFLILSGFGIWLLVAHPDSLADLLYGALMVEIISVLCLIALAARAVNAPLHQVSYPLFLALVSAVPTGSIMHACVLLIPHPVQALLAACLLGGILTAGILYYHPVALIRQEIRALLQGLLRRS